MAAAGTDIELHRLRLRTAGAGSAQAVRAPLIAALEAADWPDSEGAVVLVRQLRVAGTPRQIGAAANAELRRLMAQAADGWSPAAECAPAVRFAGRTDQVACLLRDLLAGHAGRLWFWRREAALLAQPRAAAIAAVLVERPLALPSILARLEPQPEWSVLWRELDAAGAARVLAETGFATGWARALAAVTQPASDAEARLALPAAGRAIDALRGLPPHDARVVLAALSLAWTMAPAGLAGDSGVSLLRGLARRLAGATSAEAEAPGGSASDTVPGSVSADSSADASRPASPASGLSGQPISAAERSLDGVPAGSDAVTAGADFAVAQSVDMKPDDAGNGAPPDVLSGAGDGKDTASAVPAASARARADTPPSPRTESAHLVPAQPAPAATEDAAPAAWPPAGETEFLTGAAGLFFLLNVLKLPAAQACIAADGGPHAGWRWLAGLARALDFRADAPLAGFLARVCGLDSIEESSGHQEVADGRAGCLWRQARTVRANVAIDSALKVGRVPQPAGASAQRDGAWDAGNFLGSVLERLPAPAGLDALAAHVRERCGEEALAAARADLSARVLASRSHVDVHLRLADVRLAVRRAGLDIDPGWLPWLGRVVVFHYGSALAPVAGAPS